jgi:hypothetical protein
VESAYMPNNGYCTAVKKNEIMSLARKWMAMKIIMLSELNQANKAKCPMSLFICGILT